MVGRTLRLVVALLAASPDAAGQPPPRDRRDGRHLRADRVARWQMARLPDRTAIDGHQPHRRRLVSWRPPTDNRRPGSPVAPAPRGGTMRGPSWGGDAAGHRTAGRSSCARWSMDRLDYGRHKSERKFRASSGRRRGYRHIRLSARRFAGHKRGPRAATRSRAPRMPSAKLAFSSAEPSIWDSLCTAAQ